MSHPFPAVPSWQFDEAANAGRENLDPDHVARYDGKQDAAADDEVRLLADLGLGPDSIVVDLGAGTGQFALAAARAAGRVIAADVSPVMLERLHANVSDAGVTNVEIVEAGFLTYEHEGDPADVVYSRWALHHLPDFWKGVALTRMRAILRPGGVLRLSDAVYSFDLADAARALEAWCASAPDDADADPDVDWARWELEEHVSDEHSTFSWLLEPMMERAGFGIEITQYSADQVFAEYVARAI